MESNEGSKRKIIKRVNIALLSLLVVCLAAAGGFVLYRHFFPAKDNPAARIPENIVLNTSTSDKGSSSLTSSASPDSVSVKPSEIATVSFSRGQSLAVKAFALSNMFPGDSQSRTFALDFTHEKHLLVHMSFEGVKESSLPLKENLVMQISLGEGGELLYKSNFSDLTDNGFYFYIKENQIKKSRILLNCLVLLPDTAGNDCAYQSLKGDIVWQVSDVSNISDDNLPVIYSPNTKQGFSALYLVLFVAASACLLSVLLISYKYKISKTIKRQVG